MNTQKRCPLGLHQHPHETQNVQKRNTTYKQNTYTHIAHTHAYIIHSIHTNMQRTSTHTHTRAHTHTHPNTHAHVHAHAHAHTYTHAQAYTHSRTHTHTLTPTHVNTQNNLVSVKSLQLTDGSHCAAVKVVCLRGPGVRGTEAAAAATASNTTSHI